MTVAELIRKLGKVNQDAKVVLEYHEVCMTDAGTDMGGDRQDDLCGVSDLEETVVLTTQYGGDVE